jgi:hypothetical protein
MIAPVLALVFSLGATAESPLAPPRLVVLIVVDQMRGDYLERFQPILKGGLSRMRDEGVWFTRAFHEHAVTATAPGHATLITGCDPARHGVIANQIPDPDRPGRFKLAAVDAQAKSIGGKGRASSSRDLLVDGLGDWLRAADPASLVVSVGLKNRSAAMLGGRAPTHCFWLDDASGDFVTSDYYVEGATETTALPAFAAGYNAAFPAAAEIGRKWLPRLAESDYDAVQATRDDMAYEGRRGFDAGDSASFPHEVEKISDLTFFPFGDARTLGFARVAFEALSLGADEAPDLLCIGLSAADYVGHAFGPDSREMAEYYAWLDAALLEIFSAIEAARPAGSVIFALSSDHGVSPMVEAQLARGLPAIRIPQRTLTTTVEAGLDQAFGDRGKDEPWLAAALPDLYLRKETVEAAGLRIEKVREEAARIARTLRGIEDAYVRDEFLRPVPTLPRPFVRSYHVERGGDVVLAFSRHAQMDYLATVGYVKTNHATHHDYDRHVPLVFLRQGMPAAIRTERVATVDAAPTLAALLGVAPTGTIDGTALELDRGRSPP